MHITVDAKAEWNTGDVLFRDGHGGDWSLWSGQHVKPICELHFARITEIRLGTPNQVNPDETLIPTAYLAPIMEPGSGDGNDVRNESGRDEPPVSGGASQPD